MLVKVAYYDCDDHISKAQITKTIEPREGILWVF